MTVQTHLLRPAGSARRVSATRAVSVGALALAVACNDGRTVTGPPARSPEASLVHAYQAPVVGDVIIMHRSTYVAAHGGVAGVNRNFTEKLGGEVRRVRTEDSSPPGTARADLTAGSVPRPAQSAGGLPRPVVSLPARTETEMCAALPAWSRTQKFGVAGNVTVSGIGDAPASQLKIVAEDGTVLNVERTWVRTSRTWQLARQTTTTPDKRFRDEVAYEHQSASGKSIESAIPIVACADMQGPVISPDKASRNFYSPHLNTLASRLFPLSEGATTYSCGDAGGDCFAQQNAVYIADVAVVSTASVAAIACVGVALVVPAACAAAGVAWAAAVATLALAQRALNRCLYMLDHPNGEELRTPGWIPTASPLALGGTARSASLLSASPPVSSADCGSGGGGGGDVGGTIQCHPEEWEISTDGGETWHYLITVQVCENVL